MNSNQVRIEFSRAWCRNFFSLSGDVNKDLHEPDSGNGIVQGVGMEVMINKVLSERFPGRVLMGKDNVRFRYPIYVGEAVTMVVTPPRTENGRSIKIEVLLKKDEQVVFEGIYLLMRRSPE